MIREIAPAKANLVLQVGPRRGDGLHEICSLFASLELADLVELEPRGSADRVECAGVEGENLAVTALGVYRAAAGPASPPPLSVRIDKRIPVAAGLGGGSADAAAALRAADALADRPLGAARLREIALHVGADVPSQIAPGHALVTGAGEQVEPVGLPPMTLVLVPQDEGLATGHVYAEADRLGAIRPRLEPGRLRALARGPSLEHLASALENDLERAALSLRPELAAVAARLRATGASATLVSGSGPTVLGVFGDRAAAEAAAEEIAGAIVTALRPSRARPDGELRLAGAGPARAAASSSRRT
ncbi:MAG TPA: 4-(cytidine 5'-diphospho)-2-C-methyl-D-erythritol kinase [Thermoleophilaceae bacterium]|nr:4-(cytidine 5'-diphospho)-2-C-methyl-D-erythritol kinase [Thermoleophilaceae bacterium]